MKSPNEKMNHIMEYKILDEICSMHIYFYQAKMESAFLSEL